MNIADFYTHHERSRRVAGVVLGALLALLVAGGWLLGPDSFFPAYWFGLMFWTQLSIGCLILLLTQFLSGGAWGKASAPFLRLGAVGLVGLLPLFIPVFFALPHIFSWTQIHAGVSSPELVRKQIWLNSPGFIVRTILYLLVLLLIIRRWTPSAADRNGTGWSGPALVFAILVISLASADWMMSVEPTFYSSLYPFMYYADSMVSTLCAVCGGLAWMQLRGAWPRRPELLLALGKLLFAAVLFWGYIVFSQFIIIWTGNLPDEADWYVIRGEHGWLWLTVFVLAFHFAVPFCLLLSQKLKRDPRRLLRFSIVLFLVHFAEMFWLMAPIRGVGFYLNPFDVLLPLVIGACWLWFLSNFRKSVTALAAVPPTNP
jgi:hypothetical protein